MAESKPVGEKVRQARRNANDGRGLTQAELCSLVGITQASLSSIEKGKSQPNKPTLIVLAQVLGNDFGEDWVKDSLDSIRDVDKDFASSELKKLISDIKKLSPNKQKEMDSIWKRLRNEIKDKI